MNSVKADLEDIQRNAKILLDTVGVSRIVIVDDEYATSVEELLGICSQLTEAESAQLPHLQEIQFSAPSEIISQDIRKVWNTLDSTEQRYVLIEARKKIVASSSDLVETETELGHVTDDFKAASSLEGILDELPGIELVLLPLGDWRKLGPDLLEDSNAAKTMVLFDRDFSREESEADHEGLRQIHQAQSTKVGYCGLVSHTIPLGQEHEYWITLSNEYDLERERFVVIAKERLKEEPPDYYGFLGMLRLTALSGHYASVKSEAWSVFESSLSEARKALDCLSVLDFDRMVFASSYKEGVWEPETLFRMFGILMRREARSRLLGDQHIVDAVTAARRLSAAPEPITEALEAESKSNESVRIQHFEIYDSCNDLNRFNTPIDLGDIFRFGSNGKDYILLSQPCDLMVREFGYRSYEDEKFGRNCAMVELVHNCLQKQESWGELPFYEERSGSSAYINFSKVLQVPVAVLDLCTVNHDGSASIDVEADPPELLTEQWRKRYPKLREFYNKLMNRYEEFKNAGLDDRKSSLTLPGSSTTLKLKPIVNDKSLKYSVKRILRVRQPWSGALLTKFAQHQARAAFEHPFGYPSEASVTLDCDEESE